MRRLSLFLLLVVILPACASVHPGDPSQSEQTAEATQTFVFNCSKNLDFVARTFADGTAWLFLPTATLKLQESAPGTYQSDSMTFKITGEEARLDNSTESYFCRNDRRQAIWEHAKLNGADYRAIGNEPGWNLEIRQQSKIILVAGYGSERYELDLPEPEVDVANRETRYNIEQDGQKIVLTISGESCRDTMSGEEFKSRVEIQINDRILRGCGRALH